MFENTINKLTDAIAALYQSPSNTGSGLELKELERRLCFSAVPLVSEGLGATDFDLPAEDSQSLEMTDASVAVAVDDAKSESSTHVADESHELIIIDGGVPDIDQLIAEFSDSGVDASQIFVLDSDQDGILQVTQILRDFNDVSAIHIISHGQAGAFELGNTEINNDNVVGYVEQLTAWQESLSTDADLLLYGCDLASSADGVELMEQLSLVTGADVAGSDDVTGNESLSGDWELEVATGTVDTLVPFGDDFAAGWRHTLYSGGPAFFFSTSGSVATGNSNISGVDSWSNDDIIAFSDPNLNFMNGGGMTGDYSVFLDALGDTRDVTGLHVVGSEISLYGGSLTLQEGDILFATRNSHTFNGLNVTKNDVIGYRPSNGDYFLVLANPLGTEIRGLTLVEADTTVGGTLVQEGSFLFSRNGGNEDDDIWLYHNSGVGTSISSLVDLDSGDFNMGGQIHGLELIEQAVTIGGTNLESGQIIITWNGNEDLPHGGATATAADAFVVDLTTTGTNATGTAFEFFSGETAELSGERLNAVALLADLQSQAPTDLSTGVSLNTDGGNDTYLLDTSGYHFMTGNAQVTMEYRFSGLTTPTDWSTLYSAANGAGGDYLSIHADGTLDWNGFTSSASYASLFDGGIHSVAMALDLTGGGLSFYVDGALAEVVATPVYGAPAAGIASFILGQYQGTELANFDPDRAFSGTLHDVRIWDDIRTATEIADSYDHKFDSSDIPNNLIVNWQMTGLSGASNNQIVDIVDPSADITLEIRNISEAGFTSSSATYGLTVAENATIGTSVGFVVPTDPDSTAGAFTFSLDGDAGGRFTIDSVTGEITVANGTTLDAEGTTPSVVVNVSDGNSSYSETIAIQIDDVNEAPVAVYGSTMTATRGTNANVWNSSNLTFTDPDAADTSDQLKYEITSGPSHGVLRLSGSILGVGDEFTVEDVELGALTYDHDGDIASTDAITFDLRDGGENGVAAQSVTLNINVTGDSPTANPDSYTTIENASYETHSGWWDRDWLYRQRLDLDNSSSASPLTNYAVLVTLDSGNIDYSEVQGAGEDLRFIDGDGTVLDYEIETWDEAGSSYVWVEVPQIDANSSSDFVWMYYGNSAATAGQNPNGVWDSEYAAVHHFANFNDSTTNAQDFAGGEIDDWSGIVGRGDRFDGDNDFINLGSDPVITDLFTGGGTVSAWINPHGWGENGRGRILDKADGIVPSPSGWSLAVDEAGGEGYLAFEVGFSTSFGRWVTDAGSLNTNTWQHIAISYDNSSSSQDPRIYIDGVEVNITESRTPAGTVESDAANNLTIGNHTTGDRTFDGVIDELRIESSIRSASDIAADYEIVNSGIVSMSGPQSSISLGVLGNDTDPDSDTLTVTLLSGPSHADAFTLNSDGSFDYTPQAGFTGVDSFDYEVSDGGLTSMSTATINVTEVNFAPVLDDTASYSLLDVVEDNSNPIGTSVSDLIASGGINVITDADSGDSQGVVVTDVDDTNGIWEFTTTNGASWVSFASAGGSGSSDVNVLLGETDRIRFVPNAGYVGNAGNVSFRAWDQTTGSAGDGDVDLSTVGGHSAFSAEQATATLDVLPSGAFTMTIPVAQFTDANTPITFTVADGNVVSFADGIAGDGSIRLELNTSAGTLNVLYTSGITFAEGTSNSSSRIVIHGSESSVNQALEDLMFTPSNGFTGTATIEVAAGYLTDPVGVYDFENGDATDTSSNSHDGVAQTATAFVDAERGNVMHFDGSQSINIATNFNQSMEVSVSTWVNTESGVNQEFASIGGGLRLAQLSEAAGGLTAFVNVDGSLHQISSGVTLPENEWHHIAFTFNDGDQRLYVDGVEVAFASFAGSVTYPTTTTFLGQHESDPSQGFVGMLDEFSVFGTAIDSERVAAIFNGTDNISGNYAVNVAAPPPTAGGDAFGVIEGNAASHDILSNDTEHYATIDDSSIVITSGPSNGAVVIQAGGVIEYTHNGGETVSDEIRYTVADVDGRISNEAIISITITPENDAPTAVDDSFSVVEGQTHTQTTSVFSNDADPDGPTAYGNVESGPAHGTLIWQTDGTFEYEHDGSETTTDEFTYTVDDGDGGTDQAVVQITIDPDNDAPIANDDTSQAFAGNAVTIGQAELMANDTDAELDSTSIIVLNQPLNGSVTIDSSGDVVYTANSGFSGQDSFTYSITDGVSTSDAATVTITVALPPSLPTSPPQELSESTTDTDEDVSDSDAEVQIAGGPDVGGNIDNEDGDDDAVAILRRTESNTELPILPRRTTENNVVNTNDGQLISKLGLIGKRLVATGGGTAILDATTLLVQSSMPLSQSVVGAQISQAMDDLANEMDIAVLETHVVVGAIVASSATFSIGFVYWALRAGYIAMGVISSVPAWKAFDPSSLASFLEDDEGNESVQDLLAAAQ